MKRVILGVGVVAVTVLCVRGVQAQAVYKCGPHTYSQQPCSARVVRSYDAPPQPSKKPLNVVAHRLPGETDAEFDTRRRRAALPEADRDECARLDKRVPVELERLKKPEQDEIDDAQASLADIRKRAAQLHC